VTAALLKSRRPIGSLSMDTCVCVCVCACARMRVCLHAFGCVCALVLEDELTAVKVNQSHVTTMSLDDLSGVKKRVGVQLKHTETHRQTMSRVHLSTFSIKLIMIIIVTTKKKTQFPRSFSLQGESCYYHHNSEASASRAHSSSCAS